MVMASPPQTYSGLMSVKRTFWMMMFFAPETMRMPLPLMTPLEPWPIKDLFEPTVMPKTPALSYVILLTLGASGW
jgi:hypothetical protein